MMMRFVELERLDQSEHCALHFTSYDVLLHWCRFIYTGSVTITLNIAQDLLRAADQYLLEGLKRLCEYTIAQVSFTGKGGIGLHLLVVGPECEC